MCATVLVSELLADYLCTVSENRDITMKSRTAVAIEIAWGISVRGKNTMPLTCGELIMLRWIDIPKYSKATMRTMSKL